MLQEDQLAMGNVEKYWKAHSSEELMTDGSWRFITQNNPQQANYTMCETQANGGNKIIYGKMKLVISRKKYGLRDGKCFIRKLTSHLRVF